jgi:transposase-like protein
MVLDHNHKRLSKIIKDNVKPGSTIYTDEHSAYKNLDSNFAHASVNHKEKEYVRGEVSTNGIESVWAVMKRGLNGVYHHASEKHLHRYVDEFTFRLNDGNVERTSMERLASLLERSIGKRLTYKGLISASGEAS